MIFAAGFIAVLAIFPGVNFVLDPFRYYGNHNTPPISHVDIRKVYAGLLAHSDYDALIVGSSYSENFLPSEVGVKLGYTFLRPALSGSSAWEQATVISRGLRWKKIKFILWELRPEALNQDEDSFRRGPFPLYLYEESLKTHLRYLYSVDTLWMALKSLVVRARFSTETSGTWYQVYTFGPNVVLRVYNERCRRLPRDSMNIKKQANKSPDAKKISSLMETFRRTILHTVDNNKNVHFAFYFPPYSLYKHVLDMSVGKYSVHAAVNEQIVQTLMARDNVSIYDFQAEFDIISDFANYKDTSHFGKQINDRIIDKVNRGERLRNREDFNMDAKRLKDAVIAFSQTSQAVCQNVK
tara:strand:+ start:61 stop:1119 length:1059 start_codon:yes stop_codon:yes gene_type:complete